MIGLGYNIIVNSCATGSEPECAGKTGTFTMKMRDTVKKLFSDKIYDILEVGNGFIVVYRRPEIDDKVVVSYKSVSLENGVVTKRIKADYEFVKFGPNYSTVNFQVDNFITSSCVELDGGRLFIVSKSGDAKIVEPNGCTEWQGTIRYKDFGPSAIAHFGHTLWASFSEKNALIRFNLRTMREELRIGGSNDSSFSAPEGMWIDQPAGKLLVCNSTGNNLLEVDMKTYTVMERAVFEEPVHKYLRIGEREFVVLDSGLYLL